MWRAARALWTAGIVIAGLVSLVGSGGGLGFPPCDADWCDATPLPPQPTAAVQPRYLTALVGTAVLFTAQTSHFSGTVSYQWSRSSDGGTTYADIPGATAISHSVPAVNLADDGAVYRVLARGSDASARYAWAHLAVASSPGVVIQDDDFQPGPWQATARANPSGVLPVHTESRETSGGNPAAWWKLVFEIPQGAGWASVSYLRTDATYDPASQGAVYVIDYAEDCRALQASDTMSVDSALLLEQAGRLYAAFEGTSCASTAWAPGATRASYAARDFNLVAGPACGTAEACPDFTAGAAPLRFGFRRIALGLPGDPVGHGIDNWAVTVWRR
ncbi:MAG: hypothetical protein Q8K96_04160 [Rubrivivax sp.]|nr:hypothetical protein [Rubrivivax sp.]